MKFKTKNLLLVALVFLGFSGMFFYPAQKTQAQISCFTVPDKYIDFGTVKIGEKKTLDFRVSSYSVNPLRIKAEITSGGDNFSLGTFGSAELESSLDSYKSAAFQVSFNPQSSNQTQRSGEVSVSSPDCPDTSTVTLTGIGTVGNTTGDECDSSRLGMSCDGGNGTCQQSFIGVACVIGNTITTGGTTNATSTGSTTSTSTTGGTTNSAEDFAVFESQCDTGRAGGIQTDCDHNGDSRILQEQCNAAQYQSDTQCATMPAYLNAMTQDCNRLNPSGVVCGIIDNGGFYGREASAFADYYINTHLKNNNGGGANTINNITGGTTDSACVGKNSGDSCDMGGGLGFGFCEMAGGELVCSQITGNNEGNSAGERGVYIPGGEIGLSDKSIQDILVNLLTWILEIVGVLAILGFVISGVQYIVASGNEDVMENAKRNMTYAIIGIIVVLASVVIIKAVDNILKAESLI